MTTGEEKKFSVGVVLSVVTGLKLCNFREIPALLEHMVGLSLFDHQLQRAGHACLPVLVGMFQRIDRYIDVDVFVAEVEMIRSTSGDSAARDYCDQVVAAAQARFGQEGFSIPAGCAAAFYVPRDPVAEMIEMRGGKDDSVIVVTR